MLIYENEKIALFIDGANLSAACKSADLLIDFDRLKKFFEDHAYLMKAFYYTATMPQHEINPIAKLIDWLDYNGYTIRKKIVKRFDNGDGAIKIKGNMDIEIAVDAMRLIDRVDHFVLFTGDGDFRYLVEALQQAGRRVTIVSTMDVVADELRRVADTYVDLKKDLVVKYWLKTKRETKPVQDSPELREALEAAEKEQVLIAIEPTSPFAGLLKA